MSGSIVDYLTENDIDSAIYEFTKNRMQFDQKALAELCEDIKRYYKGHIDIVGKIGGTTCCFESATANGLLGYRVEQDTQFNLSDSTSEESLDSFICRIMTAIKEIIDYYGYERIGEISLSVPGFLNDDGDFCEDLENIYCFKAGFSLKRRIRDEIQKAYAKFNRVQEINVNIFHDGVAANLGEQSRFGTCLKKVNKLFIVIIGTGLGASYLIDGKPFRGDERINYFYNELSHHLQYLKNEELPIYKYCGFETKGQPLKKLYDGVVDFEDRVSGRGIAEYAKTVINAQGKNDPVNEVSQILDKVQGDISRITTKDLGALALQGNGIAKQIIVEKGFELGVGLANFLMVSNESFANFQMPEKIILGSGVAQIGSTYCESVKNGMKNYFCHFNYDLFNGYEERIELSGIKDDTAREFYGLLSHNIRREKKYD